MKNPRATMTEISNFSKKNLRLSRALKRLKPTQKELVGNLIVFTDLFTSLVDQTMKLMLEYYSIQSTAKSKNLNSPNASQLEGNLTKQAVACTNVIDRISYPISLAYAPKLTAEEKVTLSSRIHSKGQMLAAKYYSQIENAKANSSTPKIEGAYSSSMSIYGVLNGKSDILLPAKLVNQRQRRS